MFALFFAYGYEIPRFKQIVSGNHYALCPKLSASNSFGFLSLRFIPGIRNGHSPSTGRNTGNCTRRSRCTRNVNDARCECVATMRDKVEPARRVSAAASTTPNLASDVPIVLSNAINRAPRSDLISPRFFPHFSLGTSKSSEIKYSNYRFVPFVSKGIEHRRNEFRTSGNRSRGESNSIFGFRTARPKVGNKGNVKI